jgi:hypothetical protein
MAAYYLIIEQGTTSQYAWPVYDDDNNAVALSGYTAKAQARRSITDDTVLHEWNSEDDTILLQGNQVVLITPPAASLAWTWTRGVYDILITSPDGTVSRVAEGVVEVSRSVTR